MGAFLHGPSLATAPDKVVVLSNDRKLLLQARALFGALSVGEGGSARRLGVDYAVGRKLVTRVQRSRIKEGLRRGKRLGTLGRSVAAKHTRRLAWLQSVAVDTSSLYGSDVVAVSSSAAKPLARAAALALGIPRSMRGSCGAS